MGLIVRNSLNQEPRERNGPRKGKQKKQNELTRESDDIAKSDNKENTKLKKGKSKLGSKKSKAVKDLDTDDTDNTDNKSSEEQLEEDLKKNKKHGKVSSSAGSKKSGDTEGQDLPSSTQNKKPQKKLSKTASKKIKKALTNLSDDSDSSSKMPVEPIIEVSKSSSKKNKNAPKLTKADFKEDKNINTSRDAKKATVALAEDEELEDVDTDSSDDYSETKSEQTSSESEDELLKTNKNAESVQAKKKKQSRKFALMDMKKNRKAASLQTKKNMAANQKDNLEEEDPDQTLDTNEVMKDISTKRPYGFSSGYKCGEFGGDLQTSISVTGILTTPPGGMDLQLKSVSVQSHGKLLIKDSSLTLIKGRRYGLVAPNGSGKSTLLTALASGLLPTPKNASIYLLDREFKETEMTSLEAITDIVNSETSFLLDELSKYADKADKYADVLNYIQNRIEELEKTAADSNAMEILHGLRFTDDLIHRKTKDLSGGWRMRVSLARILFVKPTIMLLDEPTNHLDLESVIWLGDYLVNELPGCIIFMVSHSQELLNEVCTDIIQIYNGTLQSYTGNYSTFCKVRAERESLIKRKDEARKKQLNKIQENLGKTGTRHVQAKQRAKSLEKTMEKKSVRDKDFGMELFTAKSMVLRFKPCGGGLPSPSLCLNDVSFKYKGSDKYILNKVNLGFDLQSRVAIVGENGSGKSTLLKILSGELTPTEGEVKRCKGLRVAVFSQDLGKQLDFESTPVRWLCNLFKSYRDHDMRVFLGRYGLTNKSQVIPIKNLSDGQRRRVIFAYLALQNPHIILMDEPTNALDIETIDNLASAIEEFDGGVIIVSHDFYLLNRVADSVFYMGGKKSSVMVCDISQYRDNVKKDIQQQRQQRELEKLKSAA